MNKRISLFFFLFSFLLSLNTLAYSGKSESEETGCTSDNVFVEVLTDTVCENSFVIDVEHDKFDSTGSTMQCTDRTAYFYLYDASASSWSFFESRILSTPASPIAFEGSKSFDIFDALETHLNSISDPLTCDETYKIRYLVSVAGYWNPAGSTPIDIDDTLYHDQEITYKCQIVHQVNVSPSQLPITTCGEDITLSTNFSSNSNYEHTWHHISPSGQIVSTNNTATVSDDGWYYVFVDNANMVCDSGRGQTRIDDNGFSTSISSTGPNSIVCNPGSGGLSTGFPTLSLDNSSNYTNYTFQWYFTNDNGHTAMVPFADSTQMIALHPGDFFLVTTDLSTGCLDTSNVIIITSEYEQEPFTLSLSGDTAYCSGESLNNALVISPAIVQSRTPPFWTFEVYNGNMLTGNLLSSINGNGNYSVIITNPAGCVYYTDTINVDIDTLPLPMDSITFGSLANTNDIYCLGSELDLVNHDFPSPGITHDLYINGNLVASSIFSTSGTYGFQLLNTRWNQITVIAQSDQQCSDTLFDHRVYVVPEGCCNDLSSLELLYGRLDNGLTYSGNYLVVEDLSTDYGAFYDISEGDFGFMGVATKAPSGLGGSASAPNIYVEDSSTLYGISTAFYGFCDTMWGGIYLDTAATIEFDSSNFEDSYVGVTPNTDVLDNPASNETYKYNGSGNIFRNNYISLTYYANRYDLFPRDGIIGGIFTSDPEEMLFPYDLESNNERPSYSYKAIDVYQGNSHSTRSHFISSWGFTGIKDFQEFDFIIENHIYGIYLNQNAQFDSLGNTHINNVLVAGHYAEENVNTMHLGYDSIVLHTQVPDDFSWQQSDEYQNKPALNVKKYALFADNRELTFKNSRFYGDGESLTSGTDQNQVYGLSFDENGTVALNEFHQMDVALELRGSNMEITVEDNIMDENVKSLKLADGAEVALDKLGCNHFTKDTSVALTQYGIYVEEGASILGDIGGPGGFGFPFPAGNGWPVDPASAGSQQSPPTTFGSSGVDVYNWGWPENWYSIYDANAANENDPLSYEYYAYRNEFFGDAEDPSDWVGDAVYPSVILNRTSAPTGTNTPCSNVPAIEYPLTRIAGLEKYEDNRIKVYPNPSVNEFWISYESENESLVDFQIIDVNGNVILSKSNVDLSQSIDISSLTSGYYIVQVQDKENKLISESNLFVK